MKNINRFRALLGALLITVVVISLSSCFLFVEPDIERWEIVESWGTESWEITDTTITYAFDDAITYKAKIVKEVEDSFNGGDTAIATDYSVPNDDHGYMIIKYTYVNNAGTGEVGKYNIFRWQENAIDDDKQDFTQGYKNIGSDWPHNVNGVFDTATEAESGATNANGYFAYPSAGASKVTD